MSEGTLIYSLIPKVMADIDPIAKERKNLSQGFMFRGIDDIYNEVQSVLSKHGIFTVPKIVNRQYKERTTAKGGVMMERILTIQYRFYATDGSYVEAEVDGEAMDTGDKTTNKCMSIAHKYALLQVFCIPTKDDKDPDGDTPPPVVKPQENKGPPNQSVTSPPTSNDVNHLLETGKKLLWMKESIVEFSVAKFGKKPSQLTTDDFKQLLTIVGGRSYTQAMDALKQPTLAMDGLKQEEMG